MFAKGMLEVLKCVHCTEGQTCEVTALGRFRTRTRSRKTFDPWALRFMCCQDRYSFTRARCRSSAGYQWSATDDECFCARYFRMATLQCTERGAWTETQQGGPWFATQMFLLLKINCLTAANHETMFAANHTFSSCRLTHKCFLINL